MEEKPISNPTELIGKILQHPGMYCGPGQEGLDFLDGLLYGLNIMRGTHLEYEKYFKGKEYRTVQDQREFEDSLKHG